MLETGSWDLGDFPIDFAILLTFTPRFIVMFRRPYGSSFWCWKKDLGILFTSRLISPFRLLLQPTLFWRSDNFKSGFISTRILLYYGEVDYLKPSVVTIKTICVVITLFSVDDGMRMLVTPRFISTFCSLFLLDLLCRRPYRSSFWCWNKDQGILVTSRLSCHSAYFYNPLYFDVQTTSNPD